MYIPGTAKRHQSVLVVDGHAGAIGHVCCPDALQLLDTHGGKHTRSIYSCQKMEKRVSPRSSTGMLDRTAVYTIYNYTAALNCFLLLLSYLFILLIYCIILFYHPRSHISSSSLSSRICLYLQVTFQRKELYRQIQK